MDDACCILVYPLIMLGIAAASLFIPVCFIWCSSIRRRMIDTCLVVVGSGIGW